MAQSESQCAHCSIGLVKNSVVVIELVVLLHEIVDIVGYESGRVDASGLGYRCGEVGEVLDERYLLLVGLDHVVASGGVSGFGGLAEH